MGHESSAPENVISESPFHVDEATYWMLGAAEPQASLDEGTTKPSGTWGYINDELEQTTVVKAESRPQLPGRAVYGPLRSVRLRPSKPFEAPGFLAAASAAIAEAGVSAMVISTFSYDYIFTRSEHLEQAVAALARRGFPRE